MTTVLRFRLRFGEKGVRMVIIRGRWSEFRMPNSNTSQWFRVFGHALKRQELQGCAWVALRLRGGVKIFCCVTPKRVAGVGFATFMEHTCPSRVPEDPRFLLDPPSRSRIEMKMTFFWLLCDGLCLECWRNIYFFASSRLLVLRRLFLSSFSLHRSSRPRSPFAPLCSGAAAAAAGRVSPPPPKGALRRGGCGWLVSLSIDP